MILVQSGWRAALIALRAMSGNWSLRGLVNVRPQGMAWDARQGFDLLGEGNPRLADTRQDLAQESGGDLQLVRQRGLRQFIVL